MSRPCGEALCQSSCSFRPKSFGGRDTETNGSSRGFLTDRGMDALVGGHVDRAQGPDQQCHYTPESSHREGGKWPASSDSPQRSRRGALAPGSWETPWQRAERYNPYLGVKYLSGNTFLPASFLPPELEALMSSSDWKGLH